MLIAIRRHRVLERPVRRVRLGSSSQSEDEVSSRKMSVGDMRSAGNGVETQKSFRCKKKQHDEESSGRRRP